MIVPWGNEKSHNKASAADAKSRAAEKQRWTQRTEMSELRDLQKRIVEKRKERGFVTDPIKVYTLLNEEIGEIAKELKKTWSPNYSELKKEDLQEEIADSFVLLSALASEFGIDIGKAVEEKFFKKDSKRTWKSSNQNQTSSNKANTTDA